MVEYSDNSVVTVGDITISSQGEYSDVSNGTSTDGNDDFTGSAAVTREEACLYAFNTLQATMVEYENSSTITVGDITITGQGDYSDVTNGTSSDGNIEDDGLMQFAERYFDDLEAEDGTDDFGRPATNWVYDGDDLGTYANDADESCVVDDASVALSDLLTDNSYLGYSDSDILDDAVIYFNGQEVDDDDSIYEDNDTREDLAGKGDIIEAFENDDGDVDTIVIRSYTYAMIDEVDEDLSSVQSDGASVGLELVDIDDESLGNGTYYDDHDDDEKVLNGWNSSYEAGTAIAVALGADDAILDSYVMETVTGTPTSARAEPDADVDFDEEYTVYLTNEGYALAVDGDATASLDDVYYVVGVYQETSRGSESYYAQAISLADGTEYDYRLDTDYETGTANKDLTSGISDTSDFKSVHAFYEFDRDGSSYDATLYTGSSRYDVVTGAGLTNDVTSSSTVIRITDGTRYYEDDDGDDSEETDQDTISRLYITDTTNFIAAESDGDELDVSTSTGMMTATAEYSSGSPVVMVSTIEADDTDALYVVYAAEELSGATDTSDIVYLADRASTRSGTDTYSGDLYFMDDMSLSEEVDIDEDSDSRDQGFYVYDLSDDVYTLEVDTGNEVDVTDGLVDDDADGYAEFVVFTEGRNNTVTSVTSHNTARSEAGGIFTDGEFDAVSISGALVVDTRDSSDADDDAYSNDINSTSRLISALGEGWVSADVYAEDGDIIFVAVRACMDDGVTIDEDDGNDDDETEIPDTDAVVLDADEISDSSDMIIGNRTPYIAYYRESGADLSSDSDVIALLAQAGATDISVSSSGFSYTYGGGTYTNVTVTLVRYYKIEVDGETHYMKNGQYVKDSGGDVNGLEGLYYGIDGEYPVSTSGNLNSNGYKVDGTDAVIESGFYWVSSSAFATATGDGTDKNLFSVTGIETNTFVKVGDTLTVELKLSGPATVDSTVTISGDGIDTETVRVDEDETGPITVTLDIADDISGNINAGDIKVSVTDR